jgi:microcystin-dependent protein
MAQQKLVSDKTVLYDAQNVLSSVLTIVVRNVNMESIQGALGYQNTGLPSDSVIINTSIYANYGESNQTPVNGYNTNMTEEVWDAFFNAQTLTGATTLTSDQSGVPAHSHGINDPGHAHTQTTSSTDGASGRADASSGGTVYSNVANINANTTGITIQNNTVANAALGHDHSITTNIKYYDFIIASKN